MDSVDCKMAIRAQKPAKGGMPARLGQNEKGDAPHAVVPDRFGKLSHLNDRSVGSLP